MSEDDVLIVCPVAPETTEVAAGPETEIKAESETSEDTDAENPEQSA